MTPGIPDTHSIIPGCHPKIRRAPFHISGSSLQYQKKKKRQKRYTLSAFPKHTQLPYIHTLHSRQLRWITQTTRQITTDSLRIGAAEASSRDLPHLASTPRLPSPPPLSRPDCARGGTSEGSTKLPTNTPREETRVSGQTPTVISKHVYVCALSVKDDGGSRRGARMGAWDAMWMVLWCVMVS